MGILDFLFPIFCLECKKQGKYLCETCIEKVLDGTFGVNNFAIFKYKGVVKKAIVAIKYKFASDVATELVDLAITRLNSKKFHDITLIPIPMHQISENFRGFNQSILLGEKIAKKLNWKFIPDLLIKTKNTKHQVGLKGDDRRKNLKRVFEVNPKYLSNKLNINSLILLFDDVYTTGTTIKEAKRVLNNNGFKKVYSLTIAR
jgi:ComF family protein